VVIEAMACGTPVITVKNENNAARNLIKNGKNGFICNLNENEIAENIIKIITNGLKKKMEIECLLTARKYNWNWAIKKIEEVYLYAA